MLTGITLKEYTTFIEKTTFDFKATNYKILEDSNVGINRILKGAIFIGENASGKTQVLDSIVLLLNLLLDNSEQNYIVKKSFYTKGTKYSLSYIFNVNDNDIKYDVSFDGNTISSEKLYVNGDIKLNRLNKSGQTNFDDEKDNNNINPNLSLLKLEYYNTKFNNDTILNEWFDFLKNSLYINCLFGKIKSYNPSKLSEQLIAKYAENNEEDKTMSISSDKNMIGLRKKGTEVTIPLMLESTGNQAFINAILPFDYAANNNCMLIVDEFSSGLHNELEEALIKYFFNNSNNSQIFLTSHSTNLLDTTIFRPDQIYSFKFDSKKGTTIKRFSDENPRESQNIEKMYLNGVFDGMPKYDKKFKN
jgi:hypothetical protein